VTVLWNIDLDVSEGEIACIVGSNGAGKTTLLRTISGVVRASAGAIPIVRAHFKSAMTQTGSPDHLMKVVFSLSHRILVLHHGALISEGTPDAVARDERVIQAYLGTRFAGRQGRTYRLARSCARSARSS
jgi:ABC-type branched-subunit amino acid transport system ATPase component